ncbi:MAG: capsule assembly Wzi family protein [Nitrospirota bacterium]
MKLRWVFSVITFALAISSAPLHASTNVDVGDEIYTILSRLEAEGVISDALLSTKPLSRKEVVRLAVAAETNAKGRGEFIKELVQSLKRRVRSDEYAAGRSTPLESAYAGYRYTSADVITLTYPGSSRQQEQAFNENNDGDRYDRGSNYRAGLLFRLENFGPLSIYLNPEYRHGNDTEKGVLKKGYAVLGFSWIDITAGRDSQWWGPGHHGALLLSNNAEPLTMLKFSGPGPQVLPGILKHLGPFQYDLFVSRLDKDRSDHPRPYFWGMRFDFKPHRNIEIGLERTALLGGRGRPTDASTWLKSVLGSGEHDASGNPGDQRAGGDVKLTLPFPWQPMQVYWARAGEEDRQKHSRTPYKWADLFGIYLPSLFGSERIDLRAEYAENEVNEQPYVWYTHGVYTAGYTYKGMVMGHHMGTESNDLFLELSCLVPEHDARISLSVDREKHNLEGPVSEAVSEMTLSGMARVTGHLEVTASFGYGRIENPGNALGPSRTVTEAAAVVRYVF